MCLTSNEQQLQRQVWPRDLAGSKALSTMQASRRCCRVGSHILRPLRALPAPSQSTPDPKNTWSQRTQENPASWGLGLNEGRQASSGGR